MTIAVPSQGPQGYVHTNGREWEIQAEVEAYFRRQPCTVQVESEMALRRIGGPGPIMAARGFTGNMRPDVLAWCTHRSYGKYLTVVEVKAGTAGRSAVQQLAIYLDYLREIPSDGYTLRGILAAPSLANSVHYLPEDITFWRIRPEWRR